ncbi:MAG: hypothetical protein HY335_05010 [Deinococcus sp.]|nr:hypothetical protein [Deinococcus sp.]
MRTTGSGWSWCCPWLLAALGSLLWLTQVGAQPASLQITAPPGRVAKPGEFVTYAFLLENTSSQTLAVTLTYHSSQQFTLLPAFTMLPIAPLERRPVPVTLAVPPNALAGVADILTLTAQTPAGEVSATVTTQVQFVPRVALAGPEPLEVLVGERLEIAFQLHNQGNGPDQFTLTLSGPGAPLARLPTASVSLAPREQVQVTISVVPQEVGVTVVILSAVSTMHSQVSATAQAILSVLAPPPAIAPRDFPLQGTVRLALADVAQPGDVTVGVELGGAVSDVVALDLAFSSELSQPANIQFLLELTQLLTADQLQLGTIAGKLFDLESIGGLAGAKLEQGGGGLALGAFLGLDGRDFSGIGLGVGARLLSELEAAGGKPALELAGQLALAELDTGLTLSLFAQGEANLPAGDPWLTAEGSLALEAPLAAPVSFDLDLALSVLEPLPGVIAGLGLAGQGAGGTLENGSLLLSAQFQSDLLDVLVLQSLGQRLGGASSVTGAVLALRLPEFPLLRFNFQRSQQQLGVEADGRDRLGAMAQFRFGQGMLTLDVAQEQRLLSGSPSTDTELALRLQLPLGQVNAFLEVQLDQLAIEGGSADIWSATFNLTGSDRFDPRVSASLDLSAEGLGGELSYQQVFAFPGGAALELTIDSALTQAGESKLQLGLAVELPLLFATPPAVTAFFGGRLAGTVRGTVFRDLDFDRVQDPEEPGVAGVRLRLGGSAVETDQAGHYQFIDVPPGPAEVSIDVGTVPVRLIPVVFRQVVEVVRDQEVPANFALIPGAELVGLVFTDQNRNGQPDPGEAGMVGVVLEVIREGDRPTTVQTDVNGHFLRTGLPPGTYTIRVLERTLPPNFVVTTASPLQVSLAPGDQAQLLFGVALRQRQIVLVPLEVPLAIRLKAEPDQVPPGGEVLLTLQATRELSTAAVRLSNGSRLTLLSTADPRVFSARLAIPADTPAGPLAIEAVGVTADGQMAMFTLTITVGGS